MTGYFGWLLSGLFASLLLIALPAIAPGLPTWLRLGAIAPLIVYHVFYLRPKAKNLAPSAVDSVYYFGFLITVSELAGVALEIASGQPASDPSVLYSFGVGLLATGYAVIARLDLQSSAKAETSASAEQVLDSYLARSGFMLDNLDMAIRNFAGLAETTMNETKRVTDVSRLLLEKSATSAIDAFDTEMRNTLASVKESIDGIRMALTDTDFVAEREALAQALRSSIKVSMDFNSTLETLVQESRSGAEALQRSKDAMDMLGTSTRTLHGGLTELAGERGALVRVTKDIEAASVASRQAADAAQDAATTMRDLSAMIKDSGPGVGEFGRSADKARRQFDTLVATCGRLDSSVEVLLQVVDKSAQFAGSLDAVGRDLPILSPKLQELSHEFDALKSAMGGAARSLEGDVERSTQAVGRLADNLTEVADTIIERTSERRARV